MDSKDISIVNAISEGQKEETLRMIHLAFREHLENGLEFTCSYYTMKDLEEKILSGQCFFAVFEGRVVGLTSVTINEEEGTAYENISAVHPDYKSKGIGTMLWRARRQYLIENGVTALLSDTSEKAKDSIRWHIRRCGCHLVGYWSYSNTNYYSVFMREDLQEVSWMRRNIIYRAKFIWSFIKVRLRFKADGSPTRLGRLLK